LDELAREDFDHSRTAPHAFMSFKKLRILGPGRAPYRLGQAMHVYDGGVLLGTLDPVPLVNGGTELHVGSFSPTRVVLEERRHLGRLIFLEACAFVSEHFSQIQAINFEFSREVEVLGEGAQQAAARVQTMDRIGATNVQVLPKADARPGVFVVSGTWAYNERNLAALHTVLDEERAIYRDDPIRVGVDDKPGLRAALLRLISGRHRG
jgi:hypothetical protein